MTGVEILYEEPIIEFNELSWVFTWIGIALLFLCIVLCMINKSTKRNENFSICTYIGMVVGLILLIASCIKFPFFREVRGYKYYCTISNDANFVEIYNKYEIIENKDDLWVLEEKDIEK